MAPEETMKILSYHTTSQEFAETSDLNASETYVNDKYELQYYTSKAVKVSNLTLKINQGLFADLFTNPEVGLAVMNNSCLCDNLFNNISSCVQELTCKHPQVAKKTLDYRAPVYSGRVTFRDLTLNYGKLEIRSQLPANDWLWSSVRLHPLNHTYGTGLKSGSIEMLGAIKTKSLSYYNRYPNRDLEHDNDYTIFSGLHYSVSGDNATDGFCTNYQYKNVSLSKENFYIFGFSWSKQRMYTYYREDESDIERIIWSYTTDNSSFWDRQVNEFQLNNEKNPWLSSRSAPFDQIFYVSIGVIVGGTLPPNLHWKDNFWINSSHPNKAFYLHSDEWYSTWDKTDSLTIDWIRIFPTSSGEKLSIIPYLLMSLSAFVVIILGIWFVRHEITKKKKKIAKEDANELYAQLESDSDFPLNDERWDLINGLMNQPNLKKFRIDMSDLSIRRIIGTGSFGIVYEAIYKDKTIALKKLNRERIACVDIEKFITEIRLLSSLSHPNIVRFIGISGKNPLDVAVLTEYEAGGDLQALLDDSLFKMSWKNEKYLIARDTASALCYLHSQNVVHRDLKSKNILINLNPLTCKIADFGLSRRLENDKTMTVGIGTILWSAPEVIRGEMYSEKADVFSYGVILAEIERRQLPYHKEREEQKMSEFTIAHHVSTGELVPDVGNKVPPSLQLLVQRCVNYDPQLRPSAIEVLLALRTCILADLLHEEVQN